MAGVLTILGLVGIHVTDGTAQLVVAIVQVLAVVYGVWRTYNAPKAGPAGPGVKEFMQ